MYQQTGLQYTYNDATGMLNNPGGGADKNTLTRAKYMEDGRGFQRVYDGSTGPSGALQRIKFYFYPARTAEQPDRLGGDLHDMDRYALIVIIQVSNQILHNVVR